MKYWQYARHTCLALLLLFVVICNALGQESELDAGLAIDGDIDIIDSINPRVGLVIVYGSANPADRDSSQVRSLAVIEMLGIGVTIPIDEELITFEPALDFGLIDLRFDKGSSINALNVPIPRNFFNPRNNSHTTALVLMLSAPIEFQFFLDQYVLVGFGISPTINLRFAVSGTNQQEITDIASYYTEAARFLTPEVYAKIGYRFSDVQVNALIRSLWPIHNIWSGSNLPFLHDLYLIVNIQLQFAL